MRAAKDHYEYIAVYSDDLLIFSRDTSPIVKALESAFILKGGSPEYYLGGDIRTTSTSTTRKYEASAHTYIKNVCAKIEGIFETTLRCYSSPLEGGYHPEVDTTRLLVNDEINRYHMLIGSANWAVTLERYDIFYAVSKLARYSAAPREGHTKTIFRVFGYLKHYFKKEDHFFQ